MRRFVYDFYPWMRMWGSEWTQRTSRRYHIRTNGSKILYKYTHCYKLFIRWLIFGKKTPLVIILYYLAQKLRWTFLKINKNKNDFSGRLAHFTTFLKKMVQECDMFLWMKGLSHGWEYIWFLYRIIDVFVNGHVINTVLTLYVQASTPVCIHLVITSCSIKSSSI